MACWGKGFPRKRLWSVNKHIVHVDELLMEDKHHLGVLRRWFFQTHLESDSVSHAVMSDSLWYPWTIAPGSFVHGILQARILEWLAFFFSKGSFWTQGSNLGLLHCRQILYHLSHQGSPIDLGDKSPTTTPLSLAPLSHLLLPDLEPGSQAPEGREGVREDVREQAYPSFCTTGVVWAGGGKKLTPDWVLKQTRLHFHS